MIDKATINEIIDFLELRDKKYMIYMGGSLCVRGLRENTNDLDLCVEPDVFWKMVEKYNANTYASMKDLKFDLTDPKLGFNVEVFKREKFDTEYSIVDGLACQTIKEIIKMKTILNRDKDRRDILMILDSGVPIE